MSDIFTNAKVIKREDIKPMTTEARANTDRKFNNALDMLIALHEENQQTSDIRFIRRKVELVRMMCDELLDYLETSKVRA